MGRRKGAPVNRNNGIYKRCDCPRKRWNTCPHPWRFNFRDYRFNLNERAGLPTDKPLSRTEAERWRDHFRNQIRDGVFDTDAAPTAPGSDDGPLTLRQAGARMVDDYRDDPSRRAHRIPILEKALAAVCRTPVDGRPFGDWPLASIASEHLLAFRKARRHILRQRERQQQERRDRLAQAETASDLKPTTELPRSRRGEVGINRQMELLRGLFNFCIKHNLLQQENPFRRFGQAVVTMAKEDARRRRLQGDEERRLLAGCVPPKKTRYAADWEHLHDLIVAALATAMRKGELLHLRWLDVDYDAHGQPVALTVSEATSKTATRRVVPVYSKDLRKVLLRRRNGPDGKPLPADAYVFGNEVGERIKDLKRSWRSLCERAGIQGLNFHDLRRECASRWFEAGMPLATVSRLLGHKSLETTFIYLGVDEARLPEEVRRFEEARNSFPPLSPTASSAASEGVTAPVAVH